MTDTVRLIVSPLGRAALGGMLALVALGGLAMPRHAPVFPRFNLEHSAPRLIASPAGLTGELA